MLQDRDLPLFLIPDCDDTLRRLSDVIRLHMICRKRACGRNASCQGGYGPPCYLEWRHLFAEAVHDEMDRYRAHWEKIRKEAELKLQRDRL